MRARLWMSRRTPEITRLLKKAEVGQSRARSLLSIFTMISTTATAPGFSRPNSARKSPTDLLVAELEGDFPGSSPCEIRVAVLQAEENLWPKKDTYVLLDKARELLRRGSL